MLRGATAVDRPHEEAALVELGKLSNWGRWGADDQRGALNLVTPEVVKRATVTVQRGEVIPLAGRISRFAPGLAGAPPSMHFMTRDGGDAAAAPNESPFQAAVDALVINYIHGTGTHIDALCHMWIDHRMYNDFSGNHVRSSGAAKLGIEQVEGIVTRAVLLDVAAVRGVAALQADDLVTDADLAAAEKATGVTVQSGDAVLVRTGWLSTFAGDAGAWSRLQPGLGPSAGLFLAKRDVCMVGSDNIAVEAWGGMPNSQLASDPRSGLTNCLHIPMLRNLGVYLLELLDLERVARAGRAEFMLTLAPLLIEGGTGSPVNPLAVL
jgi:kynurenine formamidase